jgi:hypothetical protein
MDNDIKEYGHKILNELRDIREWLGWIALWTGILAVFYCLNGCAFDVKVQPPPTHLEIPT